MPASRSLARWAETLLRRLLRIPFRLSLRCLRRTDDNIIRYAMYRHLRGVFARLDPLPAGARGLSISGSQHLARMLCPEGVLTNADYPDVNVLSLPYPDASFDYVVSDQVLEHVGGDLFTAAAECLRVLKPGGLVVHTTVLLFPIHGYPSDYWRCTPEGLRLLCERATDIVDSGGWGNRYLWFFNWLGILLDENVPLATWHPFHKAAVFNEERYPVVTWVVARK